MYHGEKPPISAAVVLSEPVNRRVLIADIQHDPRLTLMGAFRSLRESYAAIESDPPDLTICDHAIIKEPGFAMYEAMLRMCGSKLFTIPDGADRPPIARMLGLPDLTAPSHKAPCHGAPSHHTLLRKTPSIAAANRCHRLVAIGASTGGIKALSTILSQYPAHCPPTVIVQHIQSDYLDAIVKRFDRQCAANVVAATSRLPVKPGQVVFAPGLPMHLEIQAETMRYVLREGPLVSGHRPSVDTLFHSAAALKDRAVGVLLTGMGHDGALGMAAMRRAGAWTIAQDAETATVYGMPRVAAEIGAVCELHPLSQLSKAIMTAASQDLANRLA